VDPGWFIPESRSNHLFNLDPGSGFKHFFIRDPGSYRKSECKLPFFWLIHSQKDPRSGIHDSEKSSWIQILDPGGKNAPDPRSATLHTVMNVDLYKLLIKTDLMQIRIPKAKKKQKH
jgi:hypothetical protein